MMPVMQSHLRHWYAQMRSTTGDVRVRNLTELRITWEYGEELDFLQAINMFVWHARTTEQGDLYCY